jgi:hypothetical protein
MSGKTPNNAINTDSEKRREKHAPLFTAGYGERWANQTKTKTDSRSKVSRVFDGPPPFDAGTTNCPRTTGDSAKASRSFAATIKRTTCLRQGRCSVGELMVGGRSKPKPRRIPADLA